MAWPSLGATGGGLAAGDRVVAQVRTPVKASPDGESMLAAPLPGARGTIQEGPRAFDGVPWWRVAFDEGFAGWTRADDLQAFDEGVKAFPTADGFGAKALGGRGGAVIEVTNLDDSGPGSLRDAVEQEGPRTIVFRVGGTIKVERPIRIRDPYITIAGQTAPGDGIQLRNGRGNTQPPLAVETHDVVIRYLRLRPGPSEVPSCCVDALGLRGGTHTVIVDHLSLSWSVDELIGASEDAGDFTVQWSILAEALHHANHAKDDHHSRGLLASTDGGNYSIHHNLFAHNDGRNPEVAPSYGTADVVNNVLYNPGVRMIEVSDDHATPHANVVGNYMRNGKNTKRHNPHINNHIIKARVVPNRGGVKNFVMYVNGNLDELYRTDDAMPEAASLSEGDRRYLAAERQPAPFVATTLAEHAYADVLDRAGATLPKRDAVDTRVVASVRDRKSRIINDPLQVGGWPKLASGTPPVDSDHDGMPDSWERRLGLNPDDAADRNGDVTGNGYTNLEDYLNELAGDLVLPLPTDAASLQQ